LCFVSQLLLIQTKTLNPAKRKPLQALFTYFQPIGSFAWHKTGAAIKKMLTREVPYLVHSRGIGREGHFDERCQ
ncbi:hypothetical protein ILYODFUR_008673, partial [Ilyodon furcidens]